MHRFTSSLSQAENRGQTFNFVHDTRTVTKSWHRQLPVHHHHRTSGSGFCSTILRGSSCHHQILRKETLSNLVTSVL